MPEVRLVGDDGKQIGVVKTSEALAYAQERDLDLVEVAPDAKPPVCRVLDYSKFKYEQAQKQKQSRKHQQQINIREIKFRPKIAQNDYDTKKGHVKRFLLGRDRVKVTIMFRGREVTHPERGTALLEKLAGELGEVATVEQRPIQDGRNMTMMLAPSKAVLAGEITKSGEVVSPDGAAAAEPAAAEATAAETTAAEATATATATAATAAGGSPTESAAGETTPAGASDAESAPAETEVPATAAADTGASAPADDAVAPATGTKAAPAAAAGNGNGHGNGDASPRKRSRHGHADNGTDEVAEVGSSGASPAAGDSA